MKKIKYVYFFDEGDKSMKALLGGKGANLAEMTKIGLPIPHGFTITTEVCAEYSEKKDLPVGLLEEIDKNIKKLEKNSGAKFGDNNDPLLVSVRSGAAVSMPGMMDTILNLGLNDEAVEALANKIGKAGNSRFAYDSYRRFIQMFSDVVLGVDMSYFEDALENMKHTKGVEADTDLDADDMKQLVSRYKQIVMEKLGKDFPQNPKEQLKLAIIAVFGSWDNDRAISYRRLHHISGLKGTAVNVQAMVFGNMGETSGTGVCFTRDPSTGENRFYGEYLMNAQGEDVVAGIRTPLSIEKLACEVAGAYKKLLEIREKLEKHFKDMQDIEFTIQEGKLFILQTRNGKRTAKAAVKIAVDMVKEGILSEEEAIMKVDPNLFDQLLHRQIDPIAKENAKSKGHILAKGLPASPGAAVGRIVFTAEDAKLQEEKGEKVILCRVETSPEDIEGMSAAVGILTSRGGITSHAAVVARGMGKCCIAGCEDAKIDYKEKTLTVLTKVEDGLSDNAGTNNLISKTFKEMDWLTLDGNTGDVIEGKISTIDPEISSDLSEFMLWVDKYKKLSVRTNAETPRDSAKAIEFGAEGIGLCRTEHMFFEGERIIAVREMILADNKEDREKALAKLLPMQKHDFYEIFRIMDGKPVTIRLLDPPLHEFLPHEDKEIKGVAESMGVATAVIKQKVKDLSEQNPMLGHRGCRLSITYPEIAVMQTRAIIEAALDAVKEGKKVIPEIMVPLVGDVKELEILKKIIKETADKLIADSNNAGTDDVIADSDDASANKNSVISYTIGTMIETPRACLVADKIAEKADFFSFGTNDLTQMTYGFSRDDIGSFLPEYLSRKVFARDPFQAIDQEGIGQLIKIAVEKGRKTKPNLKIGICGEHGGEPSSVEFCHRMGLNYVSCSPFRVPIARLAAAQAAISGSK
ncbi:MAG: pyruvate, phosphate dikinase [Candidatus Woesearchaeota archaeon]